MQAVASPQQPTADAIFVDCQFTAGQPTTSHSATVNLNYPQRGLIAQQQIRYINRTNEVLDQIVLNAEANQWPGAFTITRLQVGTISQDVAYEITGRHIVIDLPEALQAGCMVQIDVTFQLDVPEIGGGVQAYKGYLAHTPRQLNLSNWLLTVAPHADGEWIVREPSFIGEQTVLDVADWDVTLNVSGASEALEIAGPGEVSRPSGHSWHFTLSNSRDFTLSLSEEFVITQAQTDDGVTVELYAFADAQVTNNEGRVLDGAAHSLEVAAKSLAMYSDLFGAYPYKRLVVVEGDFPDGMEFTGIVFVSKDWFTRWPGMPQSYLTIITVHEVSHQWWYAAVGNDQALAPWLDESLATYSEYIFYEEYYPDLKDWWWAFRVDNYAPEGFVDSKVYEFSSIREYINAVYLRGAHMLHDLRNDLGTDAFFALLAAYTGAAHGRIATSDMLGSLMSQDQLAATQSTRQHDLRQPGRLP